eukprot:jgi/Picsp_1/3862/NSC_01374-R1_---NA---
MLVRYQQNLVEHLTKIVEFAALKMMHQDCVHKMEVPVQKGAVNAFRYLTALDNAVTLILPQISTVKAVVRTSAMP